MEERELAPLTQGLYCYLLDKHLFALADLDLDEITAPRVREWRAERLRLTGAKTITAEAYRLLKAIMQTAVDDELITRNPWSRPVSGDGTSTWTTCASGSASPSRSG